MTFYLVNNLIKGSDLNVLFMRMSLHDTHLQKKPSFTTVCSTVYLIPDISSVCGIQTTGENNGQQL